AVEIEPTECAKDQDADAAGKTFEATEPVLSDHKAGVRIGGGDARFELLDEGDVGRGPILDSAKSDPVGGAQPDFVARLRGQNAGPVGGGGAPEARFEDFDRADLVVGEAAVAAAGLPLEVARRESIKPLGSPRTGLEAVLRISHPRLSACMGPAGAFLR